MNFCHMKYDVTIGIPTDIEFCIVSVIREYRISDSG